jgi:hypothetical protein
MMNRKFFVMAEAGTEGTGAGGTAINNPPPIAAPDVDAKGGDDAAALAAKAAAANAPKGDFVLPEKWYEKLPDDLKNEPTLRNFTDFNHLVKSLVHAQKAIGADKLVKPSKHATDADIKEFYKASGLLPESLDKYDVKPPPIFEKDQEGFNKLKAAAFEADISPKQFQKLADAYGTDLAQQIVKNQTMAKEAQAIGINGLKAEWGKKYDENLRAAGHALNKFGDDSLKKMLDTTGLGNHPAILKAFAKMGENLVEHTIDKGGAGNQERNFTPKEAAAKSAAIMGNPAHPYYLKDHPGHLAAVEEMKGLFEMQYVDAGA